MALVRVKRKFLICAILKNETLYMSMIEQPAKKPLQGISKNIHLFSAANIVVSLTRVKSTGIEHEIKLFGMI